MEKSIWWTGESNIAIESLNMMKLLLIIVAGILIYTCDAKKKPYPFTYHPIDPLFANPNFVDDRWRMRLPKPTVPQYWYYTFGKNYSYPTPPPRPDFYDPKAEDKCNMNNCFAFYNPVCGLNRQAMKFRWFDSMCHLILNNLCVNALTTIKYDAVKYENCVKYVFIRSEDCPKACPYEVDPVCGQSKVDGHIVAFKNSCLMSLRNCDPGQVADEYQTTSSDQCSDILRNVLQ